MFMQPKLFDVMEANELRFSSDICIRTEDLAKATKLTERLSVSKNGGRGWEEPAIPTELPSDSSPLRLKNTVLQTVSATGSVETSKDTTISAEFQKERERLMMISKSTPETKTTISLICKNTPEKCYDRKIGDI